ncbi:MAG: DUF5723 family protein [Bacteroidota bacterium]|nr:DUF5723 family protein [Bacteroidota bacterium]
MTKKTILLLLFPFVLIAQENKYEITWKSNFLFESNSLNKNFLNSMLYGGQITDDIKSEWIASGDEENNIINSEISNGLSYTYHFNKQSIKFEFTDINIVNSQFTDDFLRLFFEGNVDHQNETLDFSNTNIKANRFQQYKIRYSRTINSVNINGGLSYLAGNHHLSYIINQGSLYTAPFGTYLNVAYNMNAFVTDTSNFSIFANNGNGVAIDFSTNFSIQEYDIHLSLTDLGFIMWKASSISLATDSAFNFQGVEIEDIFNFNDSVLEANNIIDDVLRTNNTSFKSYIPAIIHLSVSGETDYTYLKTYTAGLLAKWQPYMDNKPLSFSKINQGFQESNFSPLYYIHSILNTKYCDFVPTLSHGGYSNDTNIGLALSKGKKNKLVIGTHHLEDIFNGEKATAVSLYFNIQLQF